ncbi:MAG: hypothetical protein ACLFVP_05125 [Candidatus Bathyarchaeia archaeon]
MCAALIPYCKRRFQKVDGGLEICISCIDSMGEVKGKEECLWEGFLLPVSCSGIEQFLVCALTRLMVVVVVCAILGRLVADP